MLSCLICSESLSQKENAKKFSKSKSKSKLIWRREIFPRFCQLLGIPTDEIEDLAEDYDFEKEFPYCANCIHFPVMLSTRSESRDTLEAEILQMQLSICSKLRKLEEVCDDVDEILRQVRRTVESNSGPTRRDFADLRRNKFRKLVSGSNCRNKRKPPLNPRIQEPMIVPLSRTSTSTSGGRQLTKSKNRRPDFVIVSETATCPLPMTEVKVESCDENLDDAESWTDETSGNVDDIEVPVINTIGGNNFILVNSIATDENNDISNQPFFIVPDPEGKEKADSSHLKNTIVSPSNRKVDDDPVPKKAEPGRSESSKRKLSRGKTINYSDAGNSQSSDEDSNSNLMDCNEDGDMDYLFKGDQNRTTPSLQLQEDDNSIRPYPISKDDLVHSKLIGDLQSTDDGQLSFRNIPVIRTSNNIFKCGTCDHECLPAGGRNILDSIRKANFSIREHILISHLGGYRCTVCDKNGMDSNEFTSHMLYTHKTQKERDAEIKAGLKARRRQEWTCHICGKCYGEKSSLCRHMENHRDKAEREKEKVPCQFCSKTFYPSRLRMHLKSIHPSLILKFKCFNCDEKFTSLPLRNQHVRDDHAGLFKCDICDQVYKNYRQLKTHKKIHTQVG